MQTHFLCFWSLYFLRWSLGFSKWESWYLHLQHRNLQRETDSHITWFTSDWFLRFWCKQLKWSTFLRVVDEVWDSREAQACCLLLEMFQLRLLQGWLFACKQKHSNGWTFWILNETFNFCGWFSSYPEDKENEQRSHRWPLYRSSVI